MDTSEVIRNLEKEALNEWSSGNPAGYFKHAAQDVSYFDDIQAQHRLTGKQPIAEYGAQLAKMIPPHRYEMADPLVQEYGNTAIISYQYHPFADDGTPLTKWRASVVYSNQDDQWKMVHAHWTMQKKNDS